LKSQLYDAEVMVKETTKKLMKTEGKLEVMQERLDE